MRSPALVFSLVAVSALSPSLIVASPLPSHNDVPTSVDRHKTNGPVSARGLGFLNEVFARAEPTETMQMRPAPTSRPKVATIAGYTLGGRSFWKRNTKDLERVKRSPNDNKHSRLDADGHGRDKSREKNSKDNHDTLASVVKRVDDGETMGGNAHSGTAGAVDGGSVNNDNNGGMPTILNMNSNNAGSGGGSSTGCAAAGKGASGGNASSGDSGTATGGHVTGSAGMMNVDSNNAGDAGESSSGCAQAGNSAGAGTNSESKENHPSESS